ncbi:MAG: Homoserine O-succinyltransferase [Cryomorphaceae bacterium]|nr:MAG: Homoserine O-succinyltransferase [Cryomorphaceae bacterium]
MPIKVPDNLPALEILAKEGVDLIAENAAQRQDIRPLRLLLLNLMPKKKDTEIQFARLFGNSPLQIDMLLMTTASYTPRNTEPAHLRRFYLQLDEVRDDYFDALIVTGAPVENLPFDAVQYWPELQEILEWSITHCFRRLGICWGAQVLMKQFHGLEKYQMSDKLFGVFDHQLALSSGRLMQGFTDIFPMPVSRYTYNDGDEMAKAGLEVLARSEEAGIGMARCPQTGDLYVLNHLEYDAHTLADEYHRDASEGLETALPAHYFPQDDPSKKPINRWRPFAYLLMANWINDLYRDTPYDLKTLGK